MEEKIIKIKKILFEFVKKYPVCIFYVLSNFLNSILLRLFTTGNFMLRPLFFDLSFVLFFGFLSLCIKGKKRNAYYIITSLLFIIICVANAMYYNYYNSFISVSLLYTSVFLKDFGDVVVSFALKLKDLVYIWQLIFMILIIIKFKNINFKNTKFTILIYLIPVILFGFGSILPPYNSWSRFVKLWNRVAVVDSFGVYTYQIDDIIQSLRPTFTNMFGYDAALKDVTEYYVSNSKYQTKNKYTGIFEGKNVIAIHAESLQNFTIGLKFNGQEVTPNLNKLIKESLYFNNFYSQVGVGTSSDTEFTFSTSLLPTKSGTVFVNYYDNKFTTIQNLLNEKGYYVFSMHGNVGDFWNRNIMHKNMGYDNFYSKSSFEIDEVFGLGLSDESFFNQAVPMIKDINTNIGEPFYGTLITLTNHTPWNDVEDYSDFEIKWAGNINDVYTEKYYLEDKTMGDYIKAVNYMDKCIGQFLSNMKKEGLLDNTVIVIYGDHDARLGKSEHNYMLNYDPVTDRLLQPGDENYVDFGEYNYELSKKVPLIIWSNDLKKAETINTPMGMVDVLPTLGNMLGIYNKHALGNDVMGITNGDNLVVFNDGSYVTKDIYYSAKNNEFYAINNSVISESYISDNANKANELLTISDKIIVYDLIKDLK